jgi:hypothetical protein
MAVTLASTYRESAGSTTFYIFNFSSVVDADTWDSGLGTSVVGYWANGQTNEATAGQEGIAVSNSSGTFTFGLKTTGAVNLFVLART